MTHAWIVRTHVTAQITRHVFLFFKKLLLLLDLQTKLHCDGYKPVPY